MWSNVDTNKFRDETKLPHIYLKVYCKANARLRGLACALVHCKGETVESAIGGREGNLFPFRPLRVFPSPFPVNAWPATRLDIAKLQTPGITESGQQTIYSAFICYVIFQKLGVLQGSKIASVSRVKVALQ